MEELKLLIGMVANLPMLAIWVLVGYLIYKIVIIGSVYGVIRLAINKLHDWKTKPVEVQVKMGVVPLGDGTLEALNAQLMRLVRKNGCSYIHISDIDNLKDALDIVLSKDKK